MEEFIKMLPRYRVPVVEKKQNKRKTHEEYVAELAIKNSNLVTLEEYINARTPILHKCLKHNIEWKVTPDNALNGAGCRECGLEKRSRSRKKSEEEYIIELSLKNPNINIIGTYINNRTSIEHKCNIHNFLFNIRPNDALRGKGCKYCRSDKIRKNKIKSEQEYIIELSEKNPYVKLVGGYCGMDIPTEHLCLIHNITWDVRPANVLYGEGCSNCKSDKISNALKKDVNNYILELSIYNSQLELKGEYINSHTPIEHYCKIHELLFNISPSSALRGSGCKYCKYDKLSAALKKSKDEYINDLNNLNLNIMLLGEYVNCKTKSLHKCLICKYEWEAIPSNILNKSAGCPQCNSSAGENQIRQWLDNNNILYDCQKKFNACKDKRCLPFDFYLPDYNLCIEYDGEQHFVPKEHFGGQEAFEIRQNHDNIKNEYCKNNGISLLRIPYYKNIEEELNNFLFI